MKPYRKMITELAYPGNVGFHEMAMFYQKAPKSDINKMEEIIKKEDWEGFKKLIKKVIKVDLK